ncbi:MAG: hypothetical protein HIU82_14410 [Proteobacteria bacterium]|nr:hypothetical protein [Pseudomonadota bacterium]
MLLGPLAPGALLRARPGKALAAAVLGAAASLVLLPPFARAAEPDFAADAAPVAVMGLSPAMSARQVLAVLRPQALELRRSTRPCAAAPTARCTALIRARTPDGWLTIRFADAAAIDGPISRDSAPGDSMTTDSISTDRASTDRGSASAGPPGADRAPASEAAAGDPAIAWQIRLTISGAGTTDPDHVRAAAAAHYGQPTVPAANLWCPGVAPGAPCPPDRPRLRLIARPTGASVLILSDPGLRDRLARPDAMRSAGVRTRAAAPAG